MFYLQGNKKNIKQYSVNDKLGYRKLCHVVFLFSVNM